jgi:hypothetical protein
MFSCNKKQDGQHIYTSYAFHYYLACIKITYKECIWRSTSYNGVMSRKSIFWERLHSKMHHTNYLTNKFVETTDTDMELKNKPL